MKKQLLGLVFTFLSLPSHAQVYEYTSNQTQTSLYAKKKHMHNIIFVPEFHSLDKAISIDKLIQDKKIEFVANKQLYILTIEKEIPIHVFNNTSEVKVREFVGTVNGQITNIMIQEKEGIGFRYLDQKSGQNQIIDIKGYNMKVTPVPPEEKLDDVVSLANNSREQLYLRGKPVNPGKITIDVYVTDDITDSTSSIIEYSFSALVSEIVRAQNMHDKPLLIPSLHFYRGDESPINKVDYESKNADDLLGWFSEQPKIEPADFYQILTRNGLDSRDGKPLLGLAYGPGRYSWATYNSYVPAHEIGHNLNATHSNGVVRYTGWWCDTFMNANQDAGSIFRANCYDFSDANINRISAQIDYRFRPRPSLEA